MEQIHHLHGHHNGLLVILSYIIATIAAFASIDLARRVKVTQGIARQIWLFSGALSLGLGIWSMHFIAMLAFHLPVDINYNVFLVIVSVIAAILGCYAGFYIVQKGPFSYLRLLSASILMSVGIISMHYIGMDAMEPVIITYDNGWVIVSVLIALGASIAALWLGFYSPFVEKGMTWWLKVFFALIMGAAIAGLHYTGMVAANFYLPSNVGEVSGSQFDLRLLTLSVTVIISCIFVIVFVSIIIDRMWRRSGIVQDTILDSAEDGIVVTDKEGQILHANTAFYKLFNQDIRTKKTLYLQDIHPDFTQLFDQIKSVEVEVEGLSELITLEVTRHLIKGEGLQDYLWFIRDITEKKRSEETIHFMAYHDILTKLPNRYKLDKVLEKAIGKKERIACVFLDLDSLKFTNDSLGHQAGDELLQLGAKRLSSVVEDQDILARLGGDEFVLLLFGDRADMALDIANQCIKKMNIPFSVTGNNIRVTLSGGISVYPDDVTSATELLRLADLAMYESKKNGKNQITRFNSEIEEPVLRRILIEEALIQAMDQEDFTLLYQPKIDLISNQIVGVEALIRWEHTTLGSISPVEFIPIVEERGLIHELGEWVLRQACLQWNQWTREGIDPILMAVNISPIQFAQDNFIDVVRATIEETGMDPAYLEFELTESAALTYETNTMKKMSKLKEMGIKISLDDFGTGYSSFRHLKELPINMLKIDRSFLKDFIGNPEQESIVRSMIQLGHNLNMSVLVEGVEEKEQEDWLRAEGCDWVQGFHYSKPESARKISTLLSMNEKGK